MITFVQFDLLSVRGSPVNIGGFPPHPPLDVCDFEAGSCNWQQHADNGADWVRWSGPTPNPNTGPVTDHTTHTAGGHYYLLLSSASDQSGHKTKMASPLFPAGEV